MECFARHKLFERIKPSSFFTFSNQKGQGKSRHSLLPCDAQFGRRRTLQIFSLGLPFIPALFT